MPRNCGCSSQTCSCVIRAGANITVEGNGSPGNPYVISGGAGGGAGGAMVGEVRGWAGPSAPVGWFICDGAPVSRSTYADLFAIIGTTYGPGDGSTTFNLPDLAGRVPFGADGSHALGSAGGSEEKTLTEAQLPAHAHDMSHDHEVSETSAGDHNHKVVTAKSGSAPSLFTEVQVGLSGPTIGTLSTGKATDSVGAHDHNVAVAGITGDTGLVGAGDPFNIMPPYLAINWIIKATSTGDGGGGGGEGTGISDGVYGQITVSTTTDPADTWTINPDSVLDSQLAEMAEGLVKGRAVGAGTGNPQNLTAAQLITLLTDVDPFALVTVTGGMIPIYWDGADWLWLGNVVTARPTADTNILFLLIDEIGGATFPAWGISGTDLLLSDTAP